MEPVLASDGSPTTLTSKAQPGRLSVGIVHEREAIKTHMAQHSTSPLSRQLLDSFDLLAVPPSVIRLLKAEDANSEERCERIQVFRWLCTLEGNPKWKVRSINLDTFHLNLSIFAVSFTRA